MLERFQQIVCCSLVAAADVGFLAVLQMVIEKVCGSWLLQMFAASVEFQMVVGADL